MKNRILTLVLIATLVILAFALFACNTSIACVDHEWVDQVVVDGYVQTQVCNKCGDTRRMCDPISHNFKEHRDNGDGTHTSICGSCDGVYENLPHSYKGVVTTPAGCETVGLTLYTCDCGATYTEVIPALGHAYTGAYTPNGEGQHTRVCANGCGIPEISDCSGGNATCTVPGMCEYCGGEYIDATGHTVVVDAGIPATCTEDGLTEGKSCSVCHEIIVAQEVIPAGHTIVDDPEVPATCTVNGLTAGKHCSECGTIIVAQEVIIASHTIVVDPAIPATCTEDGLTEGSHCSVCKEVIVAQEVIPAYGHVLSERKENIVPATCTTEGSYDNVTYCSTCNEVIDTLNVVVSAKGHALVTISGVDATCTATGLTEGSYCSVCNETIDEQEIIPELGHDYAETVISATCETDGYTLYTCALCGDEKIDNVVASNGHELGEEVILNEILPTCTADGSKEVVVYCLVCSNLIESDVVIIPMIEHSYAEESAWLDSQNGINHYKSCENNCGTNLVRDHQYIVDEFGNYVCADCGYSHKDEFSQPEEDSDHIHQYVSVVVAPTCTSRGSITYKCKGCDHSVTNFIEPLGHNYESSVTDPTCTEAGYTTYTCVNCGISYADDPTESTGHSYESVVSEPTCTEDGYATYTCVNCGISYTDDFVESTGHSYESVVTEPTCTEAGYTTHTCLSCGDIYTDSEVSALEHIGGTADCENYAVCDRCGEEYGELGDHRWNSGGAWRDTGDGYHHKECLNNGEHDIYELHIYPEEGRVVEPTCTEKGYTEFICEACGGGKLRIDEVPALGHTEVVDKAVAPTCTEKGYTEGSHCSTCGEILVERVEIPASGHSYVSIVTEPTCTEEGYTTYTCTVCGDSYTDGNTPATGHDYLFNVTVPTCTEGGYTTYFCRCGDSYTDNEVPALGHAYNSVWNDCCDGLHHKQVCANGCGIDIVRDHHYVVVDTNYECIDCGYVYGAEITEPSQGEEHTHEYINAVSKPDCENNGYIISKCRICDHTVVCLIDALGHTEVIDAAVEATCTEAGLTEGKHCSVCGEVLVKQETVSANGHSHTAVVTDPTCTEQGYTTHTCHCGNSYVDTYVDANGHTEGSVVVENKVDATCTENGSYDNVVYCTVCEVELSRETKTIDALGHDEIEHDAQAPTCTEIGWDAYVTCSRCDYSTYNEISAAGHSYNSVVTPPTCTEQGYTTHTCHCGDSYEDTYVAAKGHTEGSVVVENEVDATCTENGSYDNVVYCTVCEIELSRETKTVNALGHDEINHDAQAPTCTEIGWDAYVTCSRCDYSTYNEISAAGHSYTAVVTQPTCTEQGYTTHTCHCGNSYVDTYVDAIPHKYEDSEWTSKNESEHYKTCDYGCGTEIVEAHTLQRYWLDEETGSVYERACCSICDYVDDSMTLLENGVNYPVANENELAAILGATNGGQSEIGVYLENYIDVSSTITIGAGHNATIDLNGNTITADGLETLFMAGEWASLTLEMEGGSILLSGEAGEAALLIDGYEIEWVEINYGEAQNGEQSVISTTGDTLISASAAVSIIIDSTPNTTIIIGGADPTIAEGPFVFITVYSGTFVNVDPTDSVKGKDGGHAHITHTVDEDGNDVYVVENMPAETVEAVAPTCTATGLTVGTKCSDCGTVLVAQQTVDALGHIEVVDAAVAPTCTETGLTEGSHCSECGEVLVAQEVVNALGHTEVVDAAVTPTCTATGLTEGKHCSVCNIVLVAQEIVDALGHTEAIDSAVAPTCTETGLTEGKHCSVCGEELVSQEVIPATGHVTHDDNIFECDICKAAIGYDLADTEHYFNGQYSYSGDPDTLLDGDKILIGLTSKNDFYLDFASEENLGDTVSFNNASGLIDINKYVLTTERLGDNEYAFRTSFGKYLAMNDDGTLVYVDSIDNSSKWTLSSSAYGDDRYVPYITFITNKATGKSIDLTEKTSEAQQTYVVRKYEGTKIVVFRNVNLGHDVTVNSNNDDTHTLLCSICGVISDSEACYGGKADCENKAICDCCGEEYGNALGHTNAEAVQENRVEATCTTDGKYDSVVYCSVCNTEISRTTIVITAKGHTVVVDEAVAPTCTETGLTEGSHCSECGEVLVTQEVVEALGHTEVTDAAVAPTCTATGLTEGKHCSVCNTVLVAQETVEALGHIASYTNITSTHHTFVCKREGCGYTAIEEHAFLDNGACSACEYQEYVFETNEDNATLSIVGAGKDFKAGAVTFPDAFNGKIVTGITGNNAFINNDNITSITIPDSYTFISNQAFDNCSNLTSVQFGTNSQLKMIDYYAFYNCESLSSIKIPASVNTIGVAAFANCPNLITVEFETGTNLKVISQDIFAGCTGLQSIVIPSGIEKIDISAFNGCSGLERIYIPASLTTIEQNAFYECTKLSDVCYAGSADEWVNRVVIKVPGEQLGNNNILNARIHFNSDEIHEYQLVADGAVAPTCTTNGLTNGEHCGNCGTVFVAQTVVNALGHKEVVDSAVTPTCTAAGLTAGKHCSVCGETLVAQEIVDALGHTEVVDEAVAPTCTETGLTEGKHCSVCNTVLVAQEVVSALGHDEISHEGQEATCTEIGWNEYVACSRCDYTTYSEIAPGHTYGAATYYLVNETENLVAYGQECARCGEWKLLNYATYNQLNNVYNEDEMRLLLEHGYGARAQADIVITSPIVIDSANINSNTLDEENNIWNSTVSQDGTVTKGTKLVYLNVNANNHIISSADGVEAMFITNTRLNLTNGSNGTTAGKFIASEYIVINRGTNYSNATQFTTAEFISNGDAIIKMEGNAADKSGSFAIFVSGNFVVNGSNPTMINIDEYSNAYEVHAAHILAGTYYNWNPNTAPVLIYVAHTATPLEGVTNAWILEHTYEVVEYIPGYEPTCTEGGKAYHRCGCAENVYETDAKGSAIVYDVAPLGHIEVIDEAVAPTCTTTGLTEGKHCSVCNTVLIEQQIVAANGHSNSALGDWVKNGDNTCSDVCTVCGVVLERSAHNLVDIASNGELYYGCERCDYIVYHFTLNADGNSYTLSSFGADCRNYAIYNNGDLVLPATFNGLPVTAIGAHDASSALITTSQIKTLTVPASVKSIGKLAFSGCSGLTNIYFEENSQLEIIDECAFSNCTALTSVEIPASVITIGKQAFSMPSEMNASLSAVTFEEGSQLTSIGDYAFSSCKQLTTIEIPANVTRITYGAFMNCSSLHTVTFAGNKVTYFGSAIFYGCTSLKNIDVPSTLTTLGKQAFRYCSSLESIVIPAGIVSPVQGIDDATFVGCTSLKQIVILCELKTIKVCTENGQILDAFDGCTALTDVFYAYSEEQLKNCANIDQIKAFKNATIHYNSTSVHEYTIVTDEAVAPTCTETGRTEGSHCSVCDTAIVAQETIAIDPTAHSWGEWTYDHETHTKVCIHNASHVETAEHTIITNKTGDEASLNGSCSVCKYQEYVIAAYSKNGRSGYKILSAGKDFAGGDVVIPSEIAGKEVLMFGNSSSGYQMFTDEQKETITSVYVPATLMRMGYKAFLDCKNLTEVTFAENSTLDKIYCGAFQNCTSLKKIELPDSLLEIDYDAFRGCTSLSEVILGDSLTTIGTSTFMGTAIETIYIPANVTTIGASAFRNCYNLTTVTFDENCAITEINSELFYGEKGSKLNSINIPDTVTVIHARAFRNCDGLTEIELPASLVTIGPEAFYDCDSLESIHIPASVTSIGGEEDLNGSTQRGYTFSSCGNLKSVTFGENSQLTNINNNTFSACTSLESIIIPAGVENIYNEAFTQCYSLKSVTFQSDENLKKIYTSAFDKCFNLEEIAIPSSVTEIQDRAFAVCYSNENGVRTGLKKVTFGENSQLTTVGASAFSSCGLMSECKLPDTVTSIGANAFYSCQSLKEIYIPAGVTSIYANTFYGCNAATKVYIPLGVTTIQAEAFTGCKNIDVIYYGGCCESQWNAISIGTQTNSSFLTATRHYAEHAFDVWVDNGDGTCIGTCSNCQCTEIREHSFENGSCINCGCDD